jgi:hypothetical protein
VTTGLCGWGRTKLVALVLLDFVPKFIMKTLEVGALQGFGRILDYGFEVLEES